MGDRHAGERYKIRYSSGRFVKWGDFRWSERYVVDLERDYCCRTIESARRSCLTLVEESRGIGSEEPMLEIVRYAIEEIERDSIPYTQSIN